MRGNGTKAEKLVSSETGRRTDESQRVGGTIRAGHRSPRSTLTPFCAVNISTPSYKRLWDSEELNSLPRSHRVGGRAGVRTLLCRTPQPGPATRTPPAHLPAWSPALTPSCAGSTYVADPPHTAQERCICHLLAKNSFPNK